MLAFPCVNQSEILIQSKKSTDITRLSKNARISIITIDPGKKIAHTFGHSAIRIYDADNGIDSIFSLAAYTETDESLFLFHFFSGSLHYQAVSGRFVASLLSDEKQENRTWHEQELAVSQEQIQKIYADLSRPFTRTQQPVPYDEVTNNCSLSIYRLLENNLDNLKQTNISAPSGMTYRSTIMDKLQQRPFLSLAISVLLGTKADRKITAAESFFMPENLMNQLDYTVLAGQNGNRPLVLSHRKILDSPKIEQQEPLLSNYALIYWIIAFCIFLITVFQIIELRRRRIKKAVEYLLLSFDSLLFFLSGILGVFIVYLSFFSSHYISSSNYNFLWLLPLHSLLCFSVFYKKQSKLLSIYWITALTGTTVVLFFYATFPQHTTSEIIPFMCIIFFREIYQLVRKMPDTWQHIKR